MHWILYVFVLIVIWYQGFWNISDKIESPVLRNKHSTQNLDGWFAEFLGHYKEDGRLKYILLAKDIAKSGERVLEVQISDNKSYEMAMNNAIDFCNRTAFQKMCQAIWNFIKLNVDPDASKQFLAKNNRGPCLFIWLTYWHIFIESRNIII